MLERGRLSRGAGAAIWLVLVLALVGCSGSGGSGSGDSGSGDSGSGGSGGEVGRLRAENEELRAENERLRSEVEQLREDVARAGVEDESTAVEEAEPAQEEDAGGAEEASGGGEVAVAGPGDVSGEAVPGIKPDDLPLPAGAVLEYSDEGDYNFTVEFVLDSDLASVTAFYEERLRQGGWEETDRTEYEQDGLQGVETSWERGTYVPEGSPQGDPNYEQTDETLTLIVQEIQPSGVGSRLAWNSYKLLDETS